jgi:hypothetical protein
VLLDNGWMRITLSICLRADYGRSLVVSYCITMLRRAFCSHVQSEVILGCFDPNYSIFKAAIVKGH